MNDRKRAKEKNISSSSVETQRKLRIERMNKLVDLGINPFPAKSNRDSTLGNLKKDFDSLKGKSITLAGRIKKKRTSGKIAFAVVEDESLPEGFQFVFKKDSLPDRKVWSLNFRQTESFDKIKTGIKTIETRALNPEEEERYFGDIQPGDIVRLVKVETNEVLICNVENASTYDSLESAWGQLDFDSVSGDKKYESVSEVKSHYAEKLSPQYLNKIQTNGFVAIEIKILGDSEAKLTFDNFKKLIDEGDYIQAKGELGESNSGEPSLFVSEYSILTKALRPLPDELEYENTEARYLDRVSDYKMNTVDDGGQSVRDIVRAKAKYWSIWREEMISEGFLEVECPVFESIPGGAEARPFTTFYNELDQEMFLRISLELPLKKLIAGGFENVFEIGRIFRNEGSSPQHLQEYTQIEYYTAYKDYHWSAKFVKRVYQRIVKEILGTEIQTDYYGNQINWGEWCDQSTADKMGWNLYGGWPAIPFYEAVRHFSNGEIDVEGKTDQELLDMCLAYGYDDVNIDVGRATLMDKLWKKARVNTTDPFFLILPPVELEPLAKRDSDNPNLTQRWQVVAGKAELGKAFSELNDPIDQFGRFEEQQKARDAGNDEAQFMDKEYVKAMEYGMPPMSGFGTSERFVSFLLGKHIKECVTFPHVRRQEEQKAKRTQVAHAIILNNEETPKWVQLNTAAHLAASLGARQGMDLIEIESSNTNDGVCIPMNIQHAIMMKQAADREDLLAIKLEAEAAGLVVTCFTEDMKNSSDDKKVAKAQSEKTSDQIGWLGIMVYGKKSRVEEVTQGFELFS